MREPRVDAPRSGDDAIEVPVESLSAEALRGVVQEFVTRDGTDYGSRERQLEEKVADVMRQLSRGEVRIVFEPESGTVNIVVAPSPSGRRRE